MPCINALVENIITLKPDQTIKESLKVLDENQIRIAPVVDDNGILVGMFSLACFLEDLLPKAAQLIDGLTGLAFLRDAAPAAAKKIRKFADSPVSEHMNQKFQVVYPKTALMEGMRKLVKFGSPLPIVEKDTGRFIGLISEQSCLIYLNEVLKEVEIIEAQQEKQSNEK